MGIFSSCNRVFDELMLYDSDAGIGGAMLLATWWLYKVQLFIAVKALIGACMGAILGLTPLSPPVIGGIIAAIVPFMVVAVFATLSLILYYENKHDLECEQIDNAAIVKELAYLFGACVTSVIIGAVIAKFLFPVGYLAESFLIGYMDADFLIPIRMALHTLIGLVIGSTVPVSSFFMFVSVVHPIDEKITQSSVQ